jgi:hypothetical protein
MTNANWARHTAEDDYFVKGYAGTGDAIGDVGGSSVHSHTDTSGNHTHSYTHTHAYTAGGASSTTGQAPGSSGNASAAGHTHTWTISNATETSDTEEDTTITINNCSSKANYPLYAEGILIKYTAPVSSITPLRSLMGCGL